MPSTLELYPLRPTFLVERIVGFLGVVSEENEMLVD
jgi:hypothetical protein